MIVSQNFVHPQSISDQDMVIVISAAKHVMFTYIFMCTQIPPFPQCMLCIRNCCIALSTAGFSHSDNVHLDIWSSLIHLFVTLANVIVFCRVLCF